MKGPDGRRCGDCKCYDPEIQTCRARAPIAEIMETKKNINYTLVEPAKKINDWCYHDFVAVSE